MKNKDESRLSTMRITFVLLLVAFPFIIWLIWDKCNIAESTSITADGILTYAGCATTIFVMLHEIQKSIEANKEILEQNEDLDSQRRIVEICPKFAVFITKQEDNLYSIKISNISKNVAIGILLCGEECTDLLRSEEDVDTTFSYGNDGKGEIHLLDSLKPENDKVPEMITLTYKDCDEHVANQDFCYTGCSLYDSRESEYDS